MYTSMSLQSITFQMWKHVHFNKPTTFTPGARFLLHYCYELDNMTIFFQSFIAITSPGPIWSKLTWNQVQSSIRPSFLAKLSIFLM